MLLQNLVGHSITVSVSDPWDFCSEHGTGPFTAAVEAASGEELLLKLPKSLTYKGTDFERIVMTARHVDKPLHMISNVNDVSVNLTPVPGVQNNMQAEEAFGRAARWRGWHLIGAVSEMPDTTLRDGLGFVQGVRDQLGPILAGCGFDWIEATPYRLRFRSPKVRLTILHDRLSYEIDVAFLLTADPSRQCVLRDLLEMTPGPARYERPAFHASEPKAVIACLRSIGDLLKLHGRC